jgi:hypothetical protein
MKHTGRWFLPLIAVVALVLATGWWITQNDKNAGSPIAATVPNVTGMGLGDAHATLTAAGFVVGDLTAERNDSPTGTVLAQAVQLTESAGPGSVVPLVVSAGPHPRPIGNQRLVGVGGTCDVIDTKPQSQPCIGGPLLVSLVPATSQAPS